MRLPYPAFDYRVVRVSEISERARDELFYAGHAGWFWREARVDAGHVPVIELERGEP
jgi:hypothetical protein